MPTWKVDKGETALYEGTIQVATTQGATPTPYDLTGGTLAVHWGPSMGSIHKTQTSLGTALTIQVATLGVYRFEFYPADTESLDTGDYYFDLWLRTAQDKEYCVTKGTLSILPVVGTY